jgi:hypothetical protein
MSGELPVPPALLSATRAKVACRLEPRLVHQLVYRRIVEIVELREAFMGVFGFWRIAQQCEAVFLILLFEMVLVSEPNCVEQIEGCWSA